MGVAVYVYLSCCAYPITPLGRTYFYLVDISGVED
jgi:hypothetical protein